MTRRSPGIAVASVVTVFVLAVPAGAADGGVTYSRDIAPIFQKRCQECHQPDSIGPMSLITYQDVRPWLRSIKERVRARQMPPWDIDPSVGVTKFKNGISLSQGQIDIIVQWIDAGAPEGDPADLPAPVPVTTSLQWKAASDGYGEPDLVVRSPEFTMPAQHEDVWFRPSSGLPLTEPRWVRLVEMRPTSLQGRRIMHDAIAYLVLTKAPDAVDSGIATGHQTPSDVPDLVSRRPPLMEWAVGKSYDLCRSGTGRLLLPGETISWDEHVHAAGEPITSGMELGIWFYPNGQAPAKPSALVPFTAVDRSKGLDLPPNSVTLSEGFTVLTRNTLITSFQPYFHRRGKAMLAEAILPDGRVQPISYVGNFNFNWMTNYIFADDEAPAFPKGTVIHVSAWYDNTRFNKGNPDPEQWVGYGDRTVDEMGHAWMNVVYLTDDEYQQWQASHEKPPRAR